MPAEHHVEFVGLTAEAVRLIEGLRTSPDDTKSQILVRALSPLQAKPAPQKPAEKTFDYKEGIRLPVGEKLFLFLDKKSRREGKPAATAELREDGFYMDGKLIPPSHGRPFQPAMEIVQRRLKHFSETNGGLVSLSSLRQWCVNRNGTFVSLERLKDPALKRTRGLRAPLNLEYIDLD